MITLLTGLPATGKSTLARQLGVPFLDFDDYVQERFCEPLDEATRLFHEHRAHEYARWIAHIRAHPGALVVDCLTTRAERAELLRALHPLPVRLVYLTGPLDLLLARNEARPAPRPAGEIVSRYYMQELPDPMEGFMDIYLKKVDDGVQAFGDLATLRMVLQNDTLEADAIVTVDEWNAAGNVARIEDGKIALGKTQEELQTEWAARIRYERDIRLRKCDKMSPMRWLTMTDEQKQAWADYRQALLDIPQQPGFPWGGDIDAAPWPTLPE